MLKLTVTLPGRGTTSQSQPWWEVDLDGLYDIFAIEIWNRTDGSQDRLDDFSVFVSDVRFSSNAVAGTLAQDGVWSRHVVIPGGPSGIRPTVCNLYGRKNLTYKGHMNRDS